MHLRRLVLVLVLACPVALLAQTRLTPTEAKAHLGEQATVSDQMVATPIAQSPPQTATRAQVVPAAAHAQAMAWGGAANGNFSLSGGTQQQNVMSVLFVAFVDAGRTPDKLHTNARVRADLAYGNAKKQDEPRIKTNEMLYGELRVSADAKQLVGSFRGSIPQRADTTRFWLYSVASVYHHVAFGLTSEQAYGVGVAYDVRALPGLAVALDVRHINEHFGGGERFTSWALRFQQSYSKTWPVGPPEAVRTFLLAESVELTPAFRSVNALQARTLVTFALPLSDRLAVPITFGSDYLRNAALNSKPHYWKTTIGVAYTYGPQ
jgi:hypothetical protein